jgi:Flp pilus assembly protein TadD
MQLKQYDQAIADFRKEIEATGDDAGTEQALAGAYQAKGMRAEADAATLRADKLKTNNPAQ